MSGQRIGYVRVSSTDQHTERQLDGIANLDMTFTEAISGATMERPELKAAIKYARKGDTLVVHSMDRLARNLSDLLGIVKDLTTRGVRVEFCKEHLVFNGDDSPMANLMLAVMGGVAEFERSLIKERQREGIAKAKARGVYRGGKKAMPAAKVAEIRAYLAGHPNKSEVAKHFRITRQTLYNALKRIDANQAA
jgi:DNA invertase Pin-like site-specific DNA recombinase